MEANILAFTWRPSQNKDFTSIGIPIIQIRWSHDRHIFITEIPHLERLSLYWDRPLVLTPEAAVIAPAPMKQPWRVWVRWVHGEQIDGLVQDCSNSSALAMELLLFCTKPSKPCYHGKTKYNKTMYKFYETHCTTKFDDMLSEIFILSYIHHTISSSYLINTRLRWSQDTLSSHNAICFKRLDIFGTTLAETSSERKNCVYTM